MFDQLTANFAGTVRHERLAGREYLVAPLSMLVPGVLTGNKGPILYTREAVNQDIGRWNGIPIVVNHPVDGSGRHISARSPGVLEQSGIGTVFNTRFDGRLRAEGWFDVEKTRRVSPSVLTALRAGRPMELSTGLFTSNRRKAGTFAGRRFEFVVMSYRPDHLAILPNDVGACSLNDGCGVLVNQNRTTRETPLIAPTLFDEAPTANLRYACNGRNVLPPPPTLEDLFAQEEAQAKPADERASYAETPLLPPVMKF